ncbi:Trk system potassium transporter TrkA [Peptoniphilus catoniae]|uniref:Trk system potassium transporter TrkA n=1 Tax=Peptoniphilus catoniae TaxID=1660341 RepID=UPI0010FE59E3|nr:Trk system potassium transporter TrkA [Peptoniphilus catoniae]
MKLLIIGAGKVGQNILSTVAVGKNEITIVDRSRKALSEIRESDNVESILNDNLTPELFKKFKVETYDFVISATNSDKTNILSSVLAKNMGAKYTICRVNQAESMEQIYYLRNYLGIDKIVNPNLETALSVGDIVSSNIRYQSDKFGKGKIEVIGHGIKMDKDLEGKKIKDIGALSVILVIGVIRDGELIIPNGDFVLRDKDYLYLMGLSKDIMNFKMKYFRIAEKQMRKKIAIAGINEISNQLAIIFKDEDLTVVDSDPDKCRSFRKNYPNAFVINSNLKGAEFFDLNNIDKSDVFIALTDNEELNLALSLMAKKLNIEDIFLQILSRNYLKILDELEFTGVLNPINIASNAIIKTISKDKGISTYMTFDGLAEVLELKLPDDTSLIGHKLKDAKIPPGVLIGGIVREDGTVIVPRGNSEFKKGDSIVVFCKKENKKDLEYFIKEKGDNFFLNLIR